MSRKRRRSPDSDLEKDARIKAVLRDAARGLAAGDAIDTTALERAHPELMPELGEQLRALSIMERAREQAARETPPTPPAGSREAWLDEDLEFLRRTLSDYEVLGRLQYGGQGVVYEARQKGANRLVALKVLLDGPLATQRQQQRFEREVELISRLQHPNIVRLYDTGTIRGRHYFAMEFVEGVPIHEHVLLEDLTPREIVALFVKVCRAVGYAHLNGIIHRDLSPANILVDEQGEPHIFDFGLAKDVWSSGDAPAYSFTGQVVGTLPFLSPEQAGGLDGKVDVRSDLYTLGVVLYRLLTDAYPYPVDVEPQQVRNAILGTDPIPLRKAAGQGGADRVRELGTIDRDLEIILGKTLAKEKEARYQSAAALADDLERWLAGEAITARADSYVYLLRKTIRRYRLPVGVAAVIFLTLAVSWVQIRAQRDNARDATRTAFDLFEKAYAFEESARRLSGGVALRDQFVGELSREMPKFEALVGTDDALDPIRVALLEKQGDLALEQGQKAAAADHYRAFLEGSLPLADSEPGSTVCLDRAVRAYRKFAGVSDDPARFYAEGIRFAERVCNQAPGRDEARYGLFRLRVAFGEHLRATERYESALEQFDWALALWAPESPDHDQRWAQIAAVATSARGNILMELGDVPSGVEALESSLRIRERIAEARPADVVSRHDLMQSYVYVATAKRDAGHVDAAKELLGKAITVGKLLRTMDPTVFTWGCDLFAAYGRLVRLHLSPKELDTAQALCDSAFELAEELARVGAGSPEGAATLAFAWILRGRVLLERGEPEQAHQDFLVARTIRAELLANDPDDLGLRDNVAVAHSWLAKSSRKLNDFQQAAEDYRAAYEIRAQLYQEQPNVVKRALDLVGAQVNLAVTYMDYNTDDDDARALQLLQEARRLLEELRARKKLAGIEPQYEEYMSTIETNISLIEQRSADDEDAKGAD